MEPTITGKNVELSPAAKIYIEKKMAKVNRQLRDILDFNVVVSDEKTRAAKDRYSVQLTLNNHGTILRAEERGDNVITATDRVEETLMRRIERYKGRFMKRVRGSSTIRTGFEETPETPMERQVVKLKSFDVKPMPLDEAIEQMELLGHDFFLFRNDETQRFNLVYRRKDGNYGLIDARS